MDWGQVSALYSSYHRRKRGRTAGGTEEAWRQALRSTIQCAFEASLRPRMEGDEGDSAESLGSVLLDRRLGLLSSPSSVAAGLFNELASVMLDLQSQRPLLSVYVLQFALRQAVLHPPASMPPCPAPVVAAAATSSIFSAAPTPDDPISLFITAVLEACPSLPQATIHEAVTAVLVTVRASGDPLRPGGLVWLVTRLLDVSLVMARRLAGPIAGGVVVLLTSLELEFRKTGRESLLGDVDVSLAKLLVWLRDQYMRQRSSVLRSITQTIAEAVSSSFTDSSPPAFSSAAPLVLLFLLDGSSPSSPTRDPRLPPLLARFLHPGPLGDDWATDLLCHAPSLLARLPRDVLERCLLLPSLHPQAAPGPLASALRVLCHQPSPPSPPIRAVLSSLLHEAVLPLLPLSGLVDHTTRLLLPQHAPSSAPPGPGFTSMTPATQPAPCSSSSSGLAATPSLPQSLAFLTSYVPPASTPCCADLCSHDALLACRRVCFLPSRTASDKTAEEEEAAAVDPWSRLPVEAFSLILSHLSPRRLAKAAVVCKAWADACRSPLLWRELYHRRWRGVKQAICQAAMAEPGLSTSPGSADPAVTPPRCSLCGGVVACQPPAGPAGSVPSSTGCMLSPSTPTIKGKKRKRVVVKEEEPAAKATVAVVPWMSVFAARWAAQVRCRRLRSGRPRVCPVVGCATLLRSELCATAHRQRHERTAAEAKGREPRPTGVS